MFPVFRLFLSPRLGLLLASNIGLARGYGSSGRYDVLRGSGGESACTLQHNIVGTCTSSSTRRDFSLVPSILERDDDAFPVPSECTCNAIFFNIWSACWYSTGNNTLPNFTHWTQICTMSSINIESDTPFSELQRNRGIRIPSWAKIRVPGNTTFDLQRAVTLAYSTSIRWTTLQIFLPVVVAVVTLLTGVAFFIYQRYQCKFLCMGWKGLKRLHFRTSHIATATIDRDEPWEIDGPVKYPHFVNFDTSFQDVPSQVVPNRALAFDPESDNISKAVPSSNSIAEKAPMGPNSFRTPMRSSVRLPWKRRPPHIKLVPATSRFRVDDVKSIFRCSADAVEMKEFDVAREVVEDLDHVSPEDAETASLIVHNENTVRETPEVLLITKDGRDFTLESGNENTVSVNSHIKIISPSVSSASPHSTMQPLSTKPTLYKPIPPPPPSHVAPAPPLIPRSLRPTESPSGSNREQPLTYLQPLSPIKKASPRVTQSYSSSNSNLRRSPAVRRSLGSERVSSPHISPASPAYFNLHRTVSPRSDRPLALQSEDDFYMEMDTNAHDHRPPPADSDTSSASFYHTSPVQGPVEMHPVRIISLDSTDPSAAFFSGPVRGAGYPSIRTYVQQGNLF